MINLEYYLFNLQSELDEIEKRLAVLRCQRKELSAKKREIRQRLAESLRNG